MGGAVGQTTAPKHATAGFSLIELMVVIAVLSVLAVGVTLSTGGPKAAGDMAMFRDVWARERALAIEGNDMRGLGFGPKGLEVLAWRDGAWQALGTPKRWRGRVVFSSRRAQPSGEPGIVFLSSGQSSAFSVQFSADDARCESDGWAELSCG